MVGGNLATRESKHVPDAEVQSGRGHFQKRVVAWLINRKFTTMAAYGAGFAAFLGAILVIGTVANAG